MQTCTSSMGLLTKLLSGIKGSGEISFMVTFFLEPLSCEGLNVPAATAKGFRAHISRYKVAFHHTPRSAQQACQSMGHTCGSVAGSLLGSDTGAFGLLLLQFIGFPLHVGLQQCSQQEAPFLLIKGIRFWKVLQRGPEWCCLQVACLAQDQDAESQERRGSPEAHGSLLRFRVPGEH